MNPDPMKKTILILTVLASLIIATTAQALEDNDGYRILQNGDVVSLEPGARLFVKLEDLKKFATMADNLKSFADGRTMNEAFQELVIDGKAFEVHDTEIAKIIQHNSTTHFAKVQTNGLTLWVDEAFIVPDSD
jgi:hypothetical protein